MHYFTRFLLYFFLRGQRKSELALLFMDQLCVVVGDLENQLCSSLQLLQFACEYFFVAGSGYLFLALFSVESIVRGREVLHSEMGTFLKVFTFFSPETRHISAFFFLEKCRNKSRSIETRIHKGTRSAGYNKSSTGWKKHVHKETCLIRVYTTLS